MAMHNYVYLYCVYHSAEWRTATGSSWMTADLFDLDGVRMARMIKCAVHGCTYNCP